MAEIENARRRLERAALALFEEHGYDSTTAAQIAARAGVTERTFFRHFSDKREVLFDGQPRLLAALSDALVHAREGAPLARLFDAFRAVVPLLESNRGFAAPRQALIARTPALAERERTKLAALVQALAGVLADEGVASAVATLAARTAVHSFADATIAWLDDPAIGLSDRLDRAERDLRAILAG